MNRRNFPYLVMFFIQFIALQISAQKICIDSLLYPDRFISRSLPLLTDKELMKIASLPDLDPILYQNNLKVTLPYKVDNSTQPYMIATTWQGGYECGQSASIANVFTYELNRLRNLPSNVPQNRYVTHFAWNFLNNGHNYTGASYYDSWEIVRMCGTPNVADYGGELWYGGERRWMTGYNLYYNAMKNRLYTGYNIQVGTPEGLMLLKQWIHNHLDGSPVGGIANFYAQYGNPNTTLPAGTEEGGKALMSTWGGSPSHTWTIAGYNDSIRYDYNGDGKYTNNLDINSDGVVDMHDWEKGGLKFMNGYAGPGWGNGGYCYMMYKALADDIGYGGIWNHRVSVQYVKENYNPLLTMKIVLKHNCRNKIKVNAGVSTNLSDTKPQFVLDFPIFNFQGGAYYMQGDSTEAGKTIEFGLDISPLLTYLNTGQQAKYFLQVIENDAGNQYTGEIVSYSLMDYTNGFNQINFPQTNVNLTNNDTTRLSVTHTVNFNKVNITNNSLPEAEINHPFSHQMNATGGTPPYHWDFQYAFSETYTSGTYPTPSAQPLSAGSTGYAVQNLGFNFPFYGEKFNKLYISPNGYIKFDNQIYSWPFLIDKVLLFKSTKMIAPFLSTLSLSGTGNGMWYEGNSQYAIIRWKGSVSGQSGSIVNVAVKIFPNGKIEYYYENLSVLASTGWISAVSRGDNSNYQFTKYYGKLNTNSATKLIVLTPPDIPTELSISDNGILSGTPSGEYNNIPITFKVTDNNMITNTKTLGFNSSGVIVNYKVTAGTDSIVNAGENVLMSVSVKNIGNTTMSNANIILRTQDTAVQLIDSIQFAGNLLPDDSLVFSNAFSFVVGTSVNDNHIIEFQISVFNTADTFNTTVFIPVRSLVLDIGTVMVADGNNNILEPSETASLILQILNTGGTNASNIQATLSTNDPYVSVSSSIANINSIASGNNANAFFIIQTASGIPDGHIIIFNVKLTANGNYMTDKYFIIQVGGNAETFETGNLSLLPWTTTGDSVWFVTTQLPYEGVYCAKSGNITDNQQVSLTVNMHLLQAGTVSFYKKISCEGHPGYTDYDFLAFYIDGNEMGRWDGISNWLRHEYPVSAGTHTFKWTYKKDYSVSTGDDCAWLDYIVFPPNVQLSNNISQSPALISKVLKIDSTAVDSVVIMNSSPSGIAFYNAEVTDFSLNGNTSWLQPEVVYGSVDPMTNGSLKLLFSSYGLNDDTYNSVLRLTYNFSNIVNIPVSFQVYIPTNVDEYTPENYGLVVYPNPFSDNLNFTYSLKETSDVSISITDINGRVLKNVFASRQKAGSYEYTWNIKNNFSESLAPGVYIYQFVCNGKIFHGKLLFTK